jgi:ATP-dependent Clp protease ATP-binding subunit ClpB
VKEEVANLKEELRPLNEKWQADRGRADELKNAKEKLAVLEAKSAAAERVGDYEKAADLKYGAIPDLKAHIKKVSETEEQRKQENTGEDNMESEIVTPHHISEIISRWTGIPVTKLTQTDRDRLLKLGDRLKERVIGQDAAVNEVTDCILRSKAGLARSNQPTGSFLFLGSTGVGKTELAKALFSELYDGDERHLVRIDMSEYTEQHSVARLIGAPPGYIGHDEGGQLTEAVRRRPYTVILFDEVEKAHPRVLTLLLQVLDEGRLTDSKGRTVDFTNSVIILTSNIGAMHLLDVPTNADRSVNAAAKNLVMAEVRNHFSPEFLNRLSGIVMFDSLGPQQLEKICHKAMGGIRKRLATRGIRVILEQSGVTAILDASYDRNYGARPLERYLEHSVVTTLSRMLISGELVSGWTVHIEAIEDDSQLDHDYALVPPVKKARKLTFRLERSASFGENGDEVMIDA